MWISKAGQDFRNFLNLWDETNASNEKENQIRMMIDGQNFVLFFIYKDDIYGTHEPHRVTLAKLISPDEEDTPGWKEDANFMAINLTRAMQGRPTQHMFKSKDVKDIEIVGNKEKIFDMLVTQAEDTPPQELETSAKLMKRPKDDGKQGIPLNQDRE